MEKKPTTGAQEKWMALVVWGVLLFILIEVTGGIAQVMSLSFGLNQIFVYAYMPAPEFLPWVILGSFIVLGVLVLWGWGRFFAFSLRMFVALSHQQEEGEKPSIFTNFLTFHKAQDPQNPDNATGSIVSKVLGIVGWILIISMVMLAIVFLGLSGPFR